MALTANREVDHFVDQEIRRYPVSANSRIFKGGLVGLNTTKYARALVAGDKCIGLAFDAADNTGGTNGERYIRVYTQGDFLLLLAGAARTDIGKLYTAPTMERSPSPQPATASSASAWMYQAPAR